MRWLPDKPWSDTAVGRGRSNASPPGREEPPRHHPIPTAPPDYLSPDLTLSLPPFVSSPCPRHFGGTSGRRWKMNPLRALALATLAALSFSAHAVGSLANV